MICGWRCNSFSLWFYYLKKTINQVPRYYQIEKFLELTRLNIDGGNKVRYFGMEW